MTSTTTGPSRWVTWVTWAAIIAPLPYGVSRLLWAAGLPVGIDAALLREFGAPGWGSAYILVLALLSEGTGIFTHLFLRTRRRTVPDRVPLVGGRRVRRGVVIGALLGPIAILANFNATTVPMMLDGFTIPPGNAGMPGWSFWGQVATFWVWGLSLSAATFAYWRTTGVSRPRRPGIAVG